MKTRKSRRTPSRGIKVVEATPQPSWSFFYDDIHDRFAAKLGFTTWGIYTSLRRYLNLDKSSCFVSQERLAIDWGTTKRTVKRAFRRLRSFGLIKVKLTGRVALLTLYDYPVTPRKRGDKNVPSEVSQMSLLRGHSSPIEQELFNKSTSYKRGGASPASGSTRNGNDGPHDVPRGGSRLTAAERATIDYKAVRRELTAIQEAAKGSGMSQEQMLETALHRAGVTGARWREIMEQFK